MPINPGDVLRVTAKMSHTENDVMNVFHVRTFGGVALDTEAVDAIAAHLDTAYIEIQAHSPAQLKFDSIEVWSVTEDRPVGEVLWPTLVEGTATGSLAPPQVSALVLFGTNTARSQGRKYAPPPAESELLDGGTLVASYLTGLANWAAEFIVPVLVTSWSFEYGNYNYTLLRFSPWIVGLVRDIYRTQRRRVRNVGS